MYQLIVVCTGNICRSPMAAGLVRSFLPERLRDHVQISSAGVYALHGNPAQPFAVEIMARVGIDISSHRARQVTSELARKADLILTMESMQREVVRRQMLWKKSKVRLFSEFCPQLRDPDIQDPYGGPLEAYQACYDTLKPCVVHLLDWLDTQIVHIDTTRSLSKI